MADVALQGTDGGNPADPAQRVRRLRQTLALSRGGKVQFLVDPRVSFAPAGSFRGAELSQMALKERTILLNPAGTDAQLVQQLAKRCFEGNVQRYKDRFRTLALIEKVPGVRGLWARIIETMTDAVIDDLVSQDLPGFADLPRFRPRLDRDATSAKTIEEILEVVNHGIDGYARRQAASDPTFRARVSAITDPAAW